MKTVIAFVGALSDLNIFTRMNDGLHELDYQLLLITCKPSLWIKSLIKGIPCEFIKYSSDKSLNLNVNVTTELLSKQVDAHNGSRFYNGVLETMDSCYKSHKISMVLIWNGNTIPTKALSDFAKIKNIPKLYLELSNIPGKIFVDPEGVNAQSLLYKKPELLNDFNIDDERYSKWRYNYILYKRLENITPLSAYNGIKHNILFPIDALAVTLFDIPKIGSMNVWEKIWHKKKYHEIFNYDQYNINNGYYNLFPMQLPIDSQLLINSKVSQYDAVIIAYERSKKQKRDLLIKPHPIDNDRITFELLNSLKNKEGIYVVNGKTFSLIEHCQEIITINSTVGLEGLIAGKQVTFLGNSFYNNLNKDNLKKYINGYLIDIDYFSATKIPTTEIVKMISRLKFQ